MTKEDKICLLNLARTEIAKILRMQWKGYKDVVVPVPSLELKQTTGTFVTLTTKDELRGCIGQIIPKDSIEKTIKQNAVSAAFYDPRFPQLESEEFNLIEVEISILSKPERLIYDGAEDLLRKIQQNVHGLIIKFGGRSATFLPQVWEEIKTKEEFLMHLCMKASLYPEEWKKGKLEVQTYIVEHFNEKELGLAL
jgi:AmmeMemoRadiSam system protein A